MGISIVVVFQVVMFCIVFGLGLKSQLHGDQVYFELFFLEKYV